ncbi:hypothetical protein Poli38472_008352 [Pythium oligandrum]|uniref:Uncharacterized protein n=1 Tax=Pythium oligandrum TaxID=41045 RepID=A0A8K1CLY6_PYTOL|nr:hypothetical protein Poli38472_008352 [Pythium oligandrum]|eukprot:TMW65710.1 hypothetical protein Poli38472_008352 [Pythium oligandrum]
MAESPRQIHRIHAPPHVARLPCVPFEWQFEGGENFYVRKCYNWFYSAVEKILLKKGERCVTITGTPGIGKSVFYAYFCDRFRQQHPDICVIAMSFSETIVTEAVVFMPGDKPKSTAVPGCIEPLVDETSSEAERQGIEVLFLCDGAPARQRRDGDMVVFTTPDPTWLRHVRKNANTYYMPVWTLVELQEAARALGLPLTDEQVETSYEIFGGDARFCLKTRIPHEFIEQGERVVAGREFPDRDDLMASIQSITTPMQLRNLLSLNDCSHANSRLVHYVPDQHGRKAATCFASPFVLQKLTEQVLKMARYDSVKLKQVLAVAVNADDLIERALAMNTTEPTRTS